MNPSGSSAPKPNQRALVGITERTLKHLHWMASIRDRLNTIRDLHAGAPPKDPSAPDRAPGPSLPSGDIPALITLLETIDSTEAEIATCVTLLETV